MLHFASLSLALIAVGLTLSPRGETAGIVALSAVIAAALAARLGAADHEGAGVLRTLRVVAFAFRPAQWAAAGRVILAGLAPSRVRPALARFRTSDASDVARAAFAHVVTAAPGMAVVEIGADSLLLHTLDETKLDARALSAAEAQIITALHGRPA